MMVSKRVKKVLIIACSVLLALCLFALIFQAYFNPSHVSEWYRQWPEWELNSKTEKLMVSLKDDNALKYYLRAALVFVDLPYDKELRDSHFEVDENGWEKDHPKLRLYIQQNEPAFALIRVGTEQPYCAITEEQRDQYGNCFIPKLRDIGRLMMMKAAMHEAYGKHDEFKETSFDLLRFGMHVSDLGWLVYYEFAGRTIEGFAYYSIVSYLQGVDDEARCSEYLNELVRLNTDRASPPYDMLQATFTRDEKLFPRFGTAVLYRGTSILNLGYISREARDSIPKNERADFGDAWLEPDFFERLIEPFDRAGGYLWFKLVEKRRLQQMEEVHHTILEASKSSYMDIFRTLEQMKIPRGKITQRWYKPTYKSLVSLAEGEVFRRASITGVALRLYFLKHGEYPERLEELTTLVPEMFLIDPFSDKPFVYIRTAEAYQFHSFGPDLDDDVGKQEVEIPSYSGSDEDCDFVFGTSGTFNRAKPEKWRVKK